MIAETLCAAVLSLGIQNARVACKYMDEVVSASTEHEVPAELIVALIHVESRWTPEAKSWANACGLTQVVPKWTGGAATNGIKYTCKQLQTDPRLSIRVGVQTYAHWLRKYAKCKKGQRCSKKKYAISLCGYNAGYRCKGDSPSPGGMRYARVVQSKQRALKRMIKKLQN